MNRTSEETKNLHDLGERAHEAYHDYLVTKALLVNAQAALKDRQAELILQGSKGPLNGKNEQIRDAQLRKETSDLIAAVRDLEMDTRAAWAEVRYHQARYIAVLGFNPYPVIENDDSKVI